MVEFYHGRRLRYEIQVQTDGRWQIARVIEDEREKLGRPFDRLDLERLERAVTADAHKALTRPGVTGVRVVRERLDRDGETGRSEEILNRMHPPVPQTRDVVQPLSGDVPVCTQFSAFFERPAVVACGSLLRGLLDRWGVTPYELMTLETASARFEQARPAVYAAIGILARQQSDQSGGDARSRSQFLHQILDEMRARARAPGANPVLTGAGGLDGVLRDVRRSVAAEDRLFVTWRAVSQYLRARRRYAGRLEAALALNCYEQSVEAVEILDAVVASLFDAPDFLRDLIGTHRTLTAATLALADLADGGTLRGSLLPDLVERLSDPLRQGRWPLAVCAIWTRSLRALSRTTPLQHHDVQGEWQALKTLHDVWLPRVPMTQQAAARAVLSDREGRLRQDQVGS